jgi:hypothetical protein
MIRRITYMMRPRAAVDSGGVYVMKRQCWM